MKTHYKRSHPVEDNPFRRIYRLLFWSGMAWTLLSLGGSVTVLGKFGFHMWVDPQWGPAVLTGVKGLAGSVLFALASCLVGLVCALPGVGFIIVSSRDEYVPKGRRVWTGSSYSSFHRFIAIGLTILVHITVICAQILSCPPFVRHWFQKPNLITQTASLFSNTFLQRPLDKSRLNEFFKASAHKGFVLFLPTPVLDRASMLPRLRDVVGSPMPYLLTPELAPVSEGSLTSPHPLTLLASYQPHLFLLIRTGLFSLSSSHWSWSRIVDESGFAAQIFLKKKDLQHNGFQVLWLRELEFIEESALPLNRQRQPWYWHAPLTSHEIEEQMAVLDTLLESMAKAAVGAKIKMFAVLPWTDRVDPDLPPIRPGFVFWPEGSQNRGPLAGLEPLLLSDIALYHKPDSQWHPQVNAPGPCQPFWDAERGQRLSVLCRKRKGESAVFRWKSPHLIEETFMERLQKGVGPTLRDALIQLAPTGGGAHLWPPHGRPRVGTQSSKKRLPGKPPHLAFESEKPLEVGVEVYSLNPHKTHLIQNKNFELFKGYLNGLDAIVSKYAQIDGVWE